MSESVPLISVSGVHGDEAPADATSGEDIMDVSGSDQDAADEARAKAIIASRIRRKHKTQKKKSRPTGNTIFVDEGEDGGATDVETVEVDGDEEAELSDRAASYEELQNVLELIKPQIVEIIDDQNGKTVITNTTRVAVAVEHAGGGDVSEPSDGEERTYSLKEVLTDCEDLEGSSNDDDAASGRSDYEELQRAIDMATDTGNTDTKDDERYSSHSVLLAPISSSSRGRKKTRKTPRRRAQEPAAQPLLSAGDDATDPLTDVEYLSADSNRSASASPRLLVPATDDQGSTDVEDIDDIKPPQFASSKHLMPGIVVTGDGVSDDDSRSGRSSPSDVSGVQGVTDIEELDDDEMGGSAAPSGLVIPRDENDGMTDVEDLELDEDEVDAPRPRPPNGPAVPSNQAAEQQIIIIQEDEDGQVTSTASSNNATGGYAPLLLVVEAQEEGGSTDVEYLGMSGDEGDDANARSAAITPDISEMIQSDSVQVQVVDSQTDTAMADSTTNMLSVPGQGADILTDTEDLELSDADGTENIESEEYHSRDPAPTEHASHSTTTSDSQPSLPSQTGPSESA